MWRLCLLLSFLPAALPSSFHFSCPPLPSGLGRQVPTHRSNHNVFVIHSDGYPRSTNDACKINVIMRFSIGLVLDVLNGHLTMTVVGHHEGKKEGMEVNVSSTSFSRVAQVLSSSVDATVSFRFQPSLYDGKSLGRFAVLFIDQWSSLPCPLHFSIHSLLLLHRPHIASPVCRPSHVDRLELDAARGDGVYMCTQRNQAPKWKTDTVRVFYREKQDINNATRKDIAKQAREFLTEMDYKEPLMFMHVVRSLVNESISVETVTAEASKTAFLIQHFKQDTLTMTSSFYPNVLISLLPGDMIDLELSNKATHNCLSSEAFNVTVAGSEIALCSANAVRSLDGNERRLSIVNVTGQIEAKTREMSLLLRATPTAIGKGHPTAWYTRHSGMNTIRVDIKVHDRLVWAEILGVFLLTSLLILSLSALCLITFLACTLRKRVVVQIIPCVRHVSVLLMLPEVTPMAPSSGPASQDGPFRGKPRKKRTLTPIGRLRKALSKRPDPVPITASPALSPNPGLRELPSSTIPDIEVT